MVTPRLMLARNSITHPLMMAMIQPKEDRQAQRRATHRAEPNSTRGRGRSGQETGTGDHHDTTGAITTSTEASEGGGEGVSTSESDSGQDVSDGDSETTGDSELPVWGTPVAIAELNTADFEDDASLTSEMLMAVATTLPSELGRAPT